MNFCHRIIMTVSILLLVAIDSPVVARTTKILPFINEVHYDPAPIGGNEEGEFIEIAHSTPTLKDYRVYFYDASGARIADPPLDVSNPPKTFGPDTNGIYYTVYYYARNGLPNTPTAIGLLYFPTITFVEMLSYEDVITVGGLASTYIGAEQDSGVFTSLQRIIGTTQWDVSQQTKTDGLKNYFSTVPPTKSPTKVPTKAPTKTPSKKPTKVPTKTPTTVPSKTPTKAPTSSPVFPNCGLFGLNIFCPFTFCGIFGRFLGLCRY